MSESTITLVMLWVHVPFAVAWIGVALMGAVLAVAPGLAPSQRAALIRLTLPFVMVAVPVIIVTGVWQTVYNPVTRPQWSWALLEELRRSTYGMALFYKHVFVVATLVATLAIKLVLVRRLRLQMDESAPLSRVGMGSLAVSGTGAAGAVATDARGADRPLGVVSWVNVACCLAILVCVVLMVYQLH